MPLNAFRQAANFRLFRCSSVPAHAVCVYGVLYVMNAYIYGRQQYLMLNIPVTHQI